MKYNDMMVFAKESPSLNMHMEFSNDSTWMEATDNFIGFLHTCGYVFEPTDIADYIMEQYDVTSGITFDTIDPRDFEGFDRLGNPPSNTSPKATESCGNGCPLLGHAICSPNCPHK